MSVWRTVLLAAIAGGLIGLGGAAALAGEAGDPVPPGWGYCAASTAETAGGVTIEQWVHESYDLPTDEADSRERVAEAAGVSTDDVECDYIFNTAGSCYVEVGHQGELPLGAEVGGLISGWFADASDSDAVRDAVAATAGVDPEDVTCDIYSDEQTAEEPIPTEPPGEEPAGPPPGQPAEEPSMEKPGEESSGEGDL